MEIKILGPGCPNCKKLYALTEKLVEENNIDATLSKVEDIIEIMKYNIISTPAVVINEKVVVKGRVPGEQELKEFLTK
ncbi:MAG: thioredoxin family protein [Bacteroidota bacterium]|nr:thioredoxin family protein [Bacteroidota bacterium]